ncbi:MAG: LuxR C-terminal-related transcriptional regulator [Actinomycetota bacterium]
MARKSLVQIRDELGRLSRSGLDWQAFSAEAIGVIGGVVGADTWCVAAADPSTLMMTGITGDHPVDDHSRFFELEYGASDFLLQTDLARAKPHVGALHLTTRGRPQLSVRWREMFEPVGLHDQLRGALVSPSGCWGFFSLARAKSSRVFSDSDVAFVSAVVRKFAEGLRAAVLADRAQTPNASSDPALLMLADDLTVVEVSERTQEVLAESVQLGDPAPPEILAVAIQGRLSIERRPSGPLATTRLAGPKGWLRAHAIPLVRREQTRIAVILEHVPPTEAAELMLRAHGLTPRQAQVTRQVLAGCSTDEIAQALHVSPLTVQQHLKSVFAKLGVGSRRELVAKLYS